MKNCPSLALRSSSPNGEGDTKPEKILVPIDVARCSPEIFELIDGLARPPRVTIIMLHVVHLNIIAPTNHVFQELAAEAKSHLEQLAKRYLPAFASTMTRVRVGEPAKEIVAETRAQEPDLLILPSHGPSLWSRMKAVWNPAHTPLVSPLAEKIMRETTCSVLLMTEKTCLSCEKARVARPATEMQGIQQLARPHPYPESSPGPRSCLARNGRVSPWRKG